MLSGLVTVDVEQMRRAGPARPRIEALIASGALVYEGADESEHWQTYDDLIGAVRRDGIAYGDCEDLAAALAAEWRVDGVDPQARTFVYRVPNSGIAHVVTASRVRGFPGPPGWGLGPGWMYVDPSVSAGMPDPTREAV